MTVTINATDGIDLENYNLDEDSGGNLVVVDPDGNTVFTYDNTANEWQLGDNIDAQSNDITGVGSLQTGEVNTTHWVDPGDEINTRVQSVASLVTNLDRFHTIKLHPETEYYISDTIDMPQNVWLDINGAVIRLNSDIDVFDLSAPSAHVSGPGMIYTPDVTFTSRVWKVDSSKFSDHVNMANTNNVGIHNWPFVFMSGSNTDGIALQLKADGNNIVLGNRFEYYALYGGKHLDLIADNGGFIGGPEVGINSWKAKDKNIHHHNTAGTEGQAAVNITGVLQADDVTTNAILNETSEGSVNFEGRMWDIHLVSDVGVKGPNITVQNYVPTQEGQFSFDVGQTQNGIGYQALGGSPPDATNWRQGEIVMDTDNPGDLYLVYGGSDAGDVTQI